MAKRRKSQPAERYHPVEKIEVYVWGKFVGAVALDQGVGYYVFAYDKDFGRTGIQLSPLHMPADDSERTFVFTDLPEETYRRLPAMLADALPDDFGNALIDKYMAEKGLPKSRITALDRLAYMGKRAMGALEFKPTRGPKTTIPTALEIGNLVEVARKAVSGSLEHDSAAEAALRSIIEVGTSANGARAKAVIGWNKKTHEIRSGQFELLPGFEHWLLKFDGMGKDRELGTSEGYGRIEYAYYLMARQAGIDIPESRLFEENGRAHFMTRRFDREDDGTKHHLQSLCAIDHLDFKKKSANSYEQLFMTIKQLKLGRSAEVEAFRRMALNVMGRNCDDHTKNFSFLLRKGGSWDLSPAYDITFAHNPKGEWTSQHLMSVNGKFADIQEEDCLALANRFGIGEGPSILRKVQDAIEQWPRFAKDAGIQADLVKRIGEQLRPLLRDRTKAPKTRIAAFKGFLTRKISQLDGFAASARDDKKHQHDIAGTTEWYHSVRKAIRTALGDGQWLKEFELRSTLDKGSPTRLRKLISTGTINGNCMACHQIQDVRYMLTRMLDEITETDLLPTFTAAHLEEFE